MVALVVLTVIKVICFFARILLTRERAYKLAEWWAVRDTLPEKIDTIILVSFGATSTRLSRGAEVTTQRVQELMVKYPEAVVLYGEFTKNPTRGPEKRLKSWALGPQAKYVGQVINTIEEEEACKLCHPNNFCRIFIVTDEAHSRGVKWVAEQVWGKAWGTIYINPVSTREVIDPEAPMEALRDPRDWIAVNIFRQLILWIPGGFWLLKGSGACQPSSEVRSA